MLRSGKQENQEIFLVKLIAGLCLILTAAACSSELPQSSKIKYDAAYSIALNGKIAEGKILSPSDDLFTIKSLIRNQLYYTVGQLNGYDGVADLSKNQVKISSVTPASGDSGNFVVTYQATLFVSWDKGTPVPESLALTMPVLPTEEGIDRFMTIYAQDCRDDFSHEPESGNFWYYYRPKAFGCLLSDPQHVASESVVTRFPMTFEPSTEQTSGKSPEYGKIWEDGKLVATTIFAYNKPEEDHQYDVATYAFNSFYRGLIQQYGKPISSVPALAEGEVPGPNTDRIELVFQTPRGQLDIGMMLVDGIRALTTEQMDFYSRRTQNSDFVSYSGHSGLGANIRALTRLGTFVPNQYQLFFINGCDTFAYVDDALREAHAAVNPEFGADKFFDVITNSMPSYFHANAEGNLTIIDSLIKTTATYREILGAIDPAQRAVVTGEQDNNWPNPF
jgi:hypothetical protein